MVVVVLTVAGLFIVYTDNRRSVCRKSCIVIVGESGRSYTIVG